MALQSSGSITLSQIGLEFGDTSPFEMSVNRGKDGTPASGIIKFSNFYGKSSFKPYKIIDSTSTLASLSSLGINTSEITSTFYDDATYGIGWGTNDSLSKSIFLDVPAASEDLRITFSGFYNSPSGSIGAVSVWDDETDNLLFMFNDSWTHSTSGQSLQVNGTIIYDKQLIDEDNRTETISVVGVNKIRISMNGASGYPMGNRYLNQLEFLKPVDVAGGYIRSVNDATYNDDGSKFFNTTLNANFNLIYYYYAYGQNSHKQPNIESNKLKVSDNSFDVQFNHYTLSGDRASSNIKFYDDNNNYLGYFRYAKYVSTWTKTTDGTHIEFYNASGTKILDVPSTDFSGLSYGNGRLYQTITFQDGKILFEARDGGSTSHETTTNHTYTVSHPFITATKMTLTITDLYSTYSTGSAIIKIGDGYSLNPPRA